METLILAEKREWIKSSPTKGMMTRSKRRKAGLPVPETLEEKLNKFRVDCTLGRFHLPCSHEKPHSELKPPQGRFEDAGEGWRAYYPTIDELWPPNPPSGISNEEYQKWRDVIMSSPNPRFHIQPGTCDFDTLLEVHAIQHAFVEHYVSNSKRSP